MQLAGKVAIVTGAGAGMGLATSTLFARESAKVVIADVDQDSGEIAAETLRKEGCDAVFIKTNVSVVEDLHVLVEGAMNKFGKVDILFSNAGMPSPVGIEEITEADWYQTIDVNLKMQRPTR